MRQNTWGAWLDRLESARSQENNISSQLRNGNADNVGASVFSLQQTVSRLKRDFSQLERSSSDDVTEDEMQRRKQVLKQLDESTQADVSAYDRRKSNGARGQNGNDYHRNLLGMQNQIMKDQDDQLDLISRGVSNLRNYSNAVRDESDLHTRLLSDVGNDVEKATGGLESEGARADYVARQSSNFKLYIIIIILIAILILLLMLGSG